MVQAHWRRVEALAAALMEHETLSGDEVREIVGGKRE